MARPSLPESSRPTYFGGTPTSSEGYDRPDIASDPVWQAQNRPGVLDYSDEAMQERERLRREDAIANLQESRQLLAEAGPTGYLSVVPEGFEQSTPTYLAQQAYVAYTMSLQGHRATTLLKYPNLAKAAVEAGIDQTDLARLVNYAEADSAAEKILASYALVYNEEGSEAKAGLGRYQVDSILKSANPIMRQAIMDVLAEKVKELEAPSGTDSASWADAVINSVGTALEAILMPLDLANKATQQAFRAGVYGSQVEESQAFAPIGIPQNIFEYWDKVGEGQYDQKLLSAARQEFGPVSVDLVLAVEQKTRDGDPDPLVSLFAEKSGDPEAMAVIADMLYGDGSQSQDMAEVSRAVDNAATGNTGQLLWSSVLGTKGLGSVGRDKAANLTNVVATLALDPTIAAGKIRSAYIATRFALEQVAPGASRAGIKAAFNMAPTRRYFTRLFDDIDRYDNLAQSDPGAAAVLREQIRGQFAEIPDETIDLFRKDGIRTVDDLVDWTVETNAMFTMSRGQVASGVIDQVDDAVVEPLAVAMAKRGQAQTRDALLPRLSYARRSRQRFRRTVTPLMPSRRGAVVIDEAFGNTSNPSELAATGLSIETATTAGQLERGGIESGIPGASGKRIDSVFKYFSSIGVGHVNIVDGRDARSIYRYARTFLSRRHAAYWSDMWRKATPDQRYDMLIGLNRTTAAAKGLDLNNPEVLARVDELITPTAMTRTSFSAKSPSLSSLDRPGAPEGPAAWPGGPALYHGTSRPIGRFTPTENETEFVVQGFGSKTFANFEEGRLAGDQSTSLYGGVFYSTVDRDRAAAYMKKGATGRRNRKADVSYEDGRVAGTIYGLGDESRMYNVQWTGDTGPRFLDLEEPAPQALRDLARGMPFYDEFGISADEADDVVVGLNRLLDDPQATGVRILDYIRGNSGSGAFENLQEVWMNLADEGWDGYKHIGGKKAGRGKKLHDVYIFFDESKVRVAPEGPAPDAITDLSIPSLFPDGSEKALFGWQTASHVALPNIREMEMLAKWRGIVPQWMQDTPQVATDVWSLGTLFGLRFATRSAIEDWWFYAVITGGNLKDLYKGRRMSTMLRETRGRTRTTVFSKKEVPALGMVNRRARAVADQLENSQSVVAQVMGSWIRGNLNPEDVALAHAAALKGDFEPMRRMAALALAQSRVSLIKGDEREYFLDLVDGPFGMKLLDELAETGRTINSGGIVDDALPAPGSDTLGVSAMAVPRTADDARRGPLGKYTPELPVEPAIDEAYIYWDRAIRGVLLGDGPAGRIAVAHLDDPQEAIRRVAQEIRDDPTGYGYAWRFAALRSESPESFAARKVQAIRGLFSDSQGNLNASLWGRVVDSDRSVRAFDKAEDGTKAWRIDISVLKGVPKEQRPQYVSGQRWGNIPVPNGVGAFMDGSWTWMGEQYARISREPIFLANYLAQRRQLAEVQSTLVTEIGDRAAKRVVSRMAEDRAYAFTLSYMDNPQNRSLLAYKIRNVSRYYRATEDFYRRMMRAGKNYPVGLWKTALIYDVLDDTGFVYTDDNGEKYFLYPGSSELMEGMNWALGKITGQDSLDMPFPFVLGGKVSMVAPSADPNQMTASLAGPMGTFTWKLLARRFPTVSRLNRVVLGEYGTTGEGSVIDDLTNSFFPGQLQKVVNTLNDDELDSMKAAAAKDAMTIAVVNDLIPEDENGPEFTNAMAKIDLIAWSSVITRFMFGLIVPASPQQYSDNISEYARLNRVVAPRPAYLKLIQKHAEAGDENPVGTALADWWTLDQKYMPYTVSRTETQGDGTRGLAALKTSRDVLDWYNNNRTGIVEKYPQSAFFLAPQGEGFDWNTWGLIVAEGLRVPKEMLNSDGTPGTFLRDLFAADGEFKHYATINDYQRDIDALDPRDPEQYKAISELESQRSADLEENRLRNPYWDMKYTQTRNFGDNQRNAERALTQTKRMVDEMYESATESEWDGTPAQAIRNAIYTYIDYANEIRLSSGADTESEMKRRYLRIGLDEDLEYLASLNLNAKLFIRNVLMADPDIKVLDLELVGATGG